MEHCTIESPLGPLTIERTTSGISKVYFAESNAITTKIPKSLVLVCTQLQSYFKGDRIEFEVDLDPEGTPFQKRVWNELLKIPYGKTRSYQQIANHLGDPKVIRAAASANGKNPIAIIIPCHRVIGSDGSLTGYAGGLSRKKWLLEHESPVKQVALF